MFISEPITEITEKKKSNVIDLNQSGPISTVVDWVHSYLIIKVRMEKRLISSRPYE